MRMRIETVRNCLDDFKSIYPFILVVCLQKIPMHIMISLCNFNFLSSRYTVTYAHMRIQSAVITKRLFYELTVLQRPYSDGKVLQRSITLKKL